MADTPQVTEAMKRLDALANSPLCLVEDEEVKVRVGDIRALLTAARPTVSGDAVERVAGALTEQMEVQDETLPSSLARERGLVWLKGWFDLRAAMQEEPNAL